VFQPVNVQPLRLNAFAVRFCAWSYLNDWSAMLPVASDAFLSNRTL